MSRWCHAVAALLVALALWIGRIPCAQAAPFQPPPLDGHVVDASAKLSEAQKRELDGRLESFRRRSGYAVVALIIPSLDGRPIEDIAYETFNTWRIGDEGKDNGVLLVLAVQEKRSRIETGKGVGGELTDLESVEILRQHVTPALKNGDLYLAVDAGTRAIQESLIDGAPDTKSPPPDPLTRRYTTWVAVGGLLLVILLAIIFPGFRWLLLTVLQSMLLSRGRGSFGGGGGYSGGGGRSGGGGASDG